MPLRPGIQRRPAEQAILDQGKTLALPLVTGPGQMEARLVESLSQLVPGAYGIREPGPDTPILPLLPSTFCSYPDWPLTQPAIVWDGVAAIMTGI